MTDLATSDRPGRNPAELRNPDPVHNRRLFRGMRAGLAVFLGIWLGGLITISLAVTTIFGHFGSSRDIAGELNQRLFYHFGLVQLVCLAGVLICGAFTWLASERGIRRLASLGLAIALLVSYLGYVNVANQMQAMWPEVRDELRLLDPPNRKSAVRERFGQYHVISVALLIVTLAEVLTLLVLLGTQRVLLPEQPVARMDKDGGPPPEPKLDAKPLFT